MKRFRRQVSLTGRLRRTLPNLEEELEPVRRMKQQNIKASEDCCALFHALAMAQGMTMAELFEDMVVERLEVLRRQGVSVELA